MTRPLPCLYIWRSAARVVRNAPSRWIARSSFHLANSKSTIGATIWMPALLTSTSSAPNVSITLAVPASTCRSSVTSMATPMARLPVESISRAVASAACRLRSAMATLAPSRANTSAISLPIPLAAPVTIATLSCKRMLVSSLDALLEHVLFRKTGSHPRVKPGQARGQAFCGTCSALRRGDAGNFPRCRMARDVEPKRRDHRGHERKRRKPVEPTGKAPGIILDPADHAGPEEAAKIADRVDPGDARSGGR